MRGYLSALLWSFLPDKLTQTILPPLSAALPSLLPPAPAGSDAWRRNYRHVLTAVVVLALAYNMASQAQAGGENDWYDLLGVSPRAGDDEMKKAFRQLSRIYHPDRLGPNAGPEAEAHFIAIRQAYEILTDPVKRFAYDRDYSPTDVSFGPSVASWQKIEGVRESIIYGAQMSVGFYMGTIGLMLVLGLLGRVQQGAYWRNVLIGVLLMLETTLILAPTPDVSAPASSEPLLLTLPRPIARAVALLLQRSLLQRPPYQLIALLHSLFANASIAISQLAAVWSPPAGDGVQRALQLAGAVNLEAVGTLNDAVGPVYAGTNDPASAERNLVSRIEQVYLDRLLEAHPAIAPAFKAAMTRELGSSDSVPGVDATGTAATIIHEISSDSAFVAAEPARTTRVTTPRTGSGRARMGRTPGLTQADAETLAAAQSTPLPPSRGNTPAPDGDKALRRSARISAVSPQP